MRNVRNSVGAYVVAVAVVMSFMFAPAAKAADAICPDASHLVSGICVSDTSSITPQSVASTENCPTPVAGQTATLNSTTHLCAMSEVSVAASLGTTYSCPSGGVLTGSGSSSTCVTSQVSVPAQLTQSFYCSSGTPTASGASGILDTCVTQVVVSSVAASTTPVWQCNYGGYQATRGGVVYCITADEVDSTPVVVSTPSCLSNATLGANGLCNAWSVHSYVSTSQNIYSCPTGQKLNGAWCQVSLSYSAPATIVGSQYICPSGGVPDGVNTPPLCQTTTLISSVAPTITDSKSCTTGTLTGSICVVTAETKYAALGSVGYAPCGSPAVNIGVNCIVYRSQTAAASVSNGYGCSAGTPSGTGSSMICITVFPSTVSATAVTLSDPSSFTGGVLVHDSAYFYRTFTSSGTLGGVAGSSPSVDLLIIAGGGSGHHGGGGGGGVYAPSNVSITTNQTVTVGGSDANSSFGSYVANAGGAGGNAYGQAGFNGGSGGGASLIFGTSGGTGSQGGNGGGGDGGSGGGGGGAGGNGSAGIASAGGNGGAGTSAFSSWASATGTGVSGCYAGGSAGAGTSSVGSAGCGAGVSSVNSAGSSGQSNTGGGGGSSNASTGASGASGLVIVRWAGVNGTYYCSAGTLSGSGSSSICITTPATSVASVLSYSGTCASGYTMNTVTGFCDTTAVTLGVPVIPTGSYYCSQRDASSSDVNYSIMTYDGSAYNGTSLRTCSLIPPVGFQMEIPQGGNVFLSSYLCELFKVDSTTGQQTTLDYPSNSDDSGTATGGKGFVTCTLVFTDSTSDSSPTDTTVPTDGSGDTSGYIDVVSGCFATIDPSDLEALDNCLNAA